MGLIGMHRIFILAVLCVWVLPLVSSSCSNLTPCRTKGGTCIPGNYICHGKQYSAVRHCKGADCICCVGSYGPPASASLCSNMSPCRTKGGTCIPGNYICHGKPYSAVRYCKGADCICCVGSYGPPASASLCSNLSPCDEKRGTCVPGDYTCHDGIVYLAPRYCEGQGCKCCRGSYHPPEGHSSEHHDCRPGRSCGHRGKCERGSCPSGYEKHSGDCGGGDCECCVRKDVHHECRRGICGLRGKCERGRGSCPSGYERHSGDCGGGDCQCCVRKDEIQTCKTGHTCGHKGRCERGRCPFGYRKHAGDCGGGDCECCVRRDEHHGGLCRKSSCGIRGTCRDNCWRDEQQHSGSCGSNCECCARTNPHGGTNPTWIDVIHGGNCRGSCGRRKVCRPYRCLSDEIEHGSCTASHHCKCCEKRRMQMCTGLSCNNGHGTCHDRHCPHGKVYMRHCMGRNCVCCANIVGCPISGSRCSGNGYCRQGSCFNNEYQIGSCGGISSCACCVKSQFPACFALGGSCLGSGFCRAGACNNNEIKTGTCSGTDCVCCSPYVQQVCTNVNGPCNHGGGTCRSLCLPGETDMGLGSCHGTACRCCMFTVCPAATCLRGPMQGTCRPNSCQPIEFDIGECITGQPNCRCCTQNIVTCPYFGVKCGQHGTCRSGGCQLGEAVHSGQCGGGYCVCCAPIPHTVLVCPTLNAVCGHSGICRTGGCLDGEALHSGDCGGWGNCVCCAAVTTSTMTCKPRNFVCGHSGTCRVGGCLVGEALHSGDCGDPNCFCCATIYITSTKVKRQIDSEDVADVAETVDTTVNIEPATLDTNYEGVACPYGYTFVGSQCILFNVKESVNWNTAEQICGRLHGRLVNVLDPKALAKFIKENYGKSNFWIGATDNSESGTWRWTNGYKLDDKFPWSGIKNNLNIKSCLEWVAKLQGYQGGDCDDLKNFICEAETAEESVGYGVSLGQATYVDECKKQYFMNVIQIICTRKQLSSRSGKSLNFDYVEVNEFHSSEEYGEYVDQNSFHNMYDSIETMYDEHFGHDEIELYDEHFGHDGIEVYDEHFGHDGIEVYDEHFGDEGIEFYDSIEENMIYEKYLNDLSLDLEDDLNSGTSIAPLIKEDKQELEVVQEQNKVTGQDNI